MVLSCVRSLLVRRDFNGHHRTRPGYPRHEEAYPIKPSLPCPRRRCHVVGESRLHPGGTFVDKPLPDGLAVANEGDLEDEPGIRYHP